MSEIRKEIDRLLFKALNNSNTKNETLQLLQSFVGKGKIHAENVQIKTVIEEKIIVEPLTIEKINEHFENTKKEDFEKMNPTDLDKHISILEKYITNANIVREYKKMK